MKTGNSKFIVIGSIALIVFLLAAVFYIFVRKDRNEAALPPQNGFKDERTVRTMNVIADSGKFTPSQIDTVLFSDIDLIVTAKDRDYEFRVQGYPRLDSNIKKGESKKIELYALGVGEYDYTCGTGCKGKIVVNRQNDTEEPGE